MDHFLSFGGVISAFSAQVGFGVICRVGLHHPRGLSAGTLRMVVRKMRSMESGGG